MVPPWEVQVGVAEKTPLLIMTRPVEVVRDEQGQVSQGELKIEVEIEVEVVGERGLSGPVGVRR